MTGKSHTVIELNQQRRMAVKLRLDGHTLAAVKDSVGLSTPTIVAAVKAFRDGGWAAVDVKPRGRPRSNAAQATDAGQLRSALLQAANTLGSADTPITGQLWGNERVRKWLANTFTLNVSEQTVRGYLSDWGLTPANRYRQLRDSQSRSVSQWWQTDFAEFCGAAAHRGFTVIWVGVQPAGQSGTQIYAHTQRGRCSWATVQGPATAQHYQQFLQALYAERDKGLAVVLPTAHLLREPLLVQWQTKTQNLLLNAPPHSDSAQIMTSKSKEIDRNSPVAQRIPMTPNQTRLTREDTPVPAPAQPPVTPRQYTDTPVAHALTQLQRLEAESIHILREVVAAADNPVMLYSMGKDSAVMLHLARKAFFPAVPPFPLLHVDTTWKFRAMYEFRDRIAADPDFDLITYVNPEGIEKGVNPFTHGSNLHTDIMKTEALKQALDKYGFDFAIGGARRDEERSRAKERVLSFRNAQHRWQPKNQRPELWKQFNTRKHKNESIRAFPLSNWTELDIWQYIYQQNIPVVPLYFAAERPVVERDGMLIMVDDDRMPMKSDEVPMLRKVRFRTLGCYPLTGAVDSEASTLVQIIQEMLLSRTSEREGRMIDHDAAASMEMKKHEGYF